MNAAELRELIATYQPKQETLDSLKDITLVALVGPTAVGKTTLIEYLVKQDPAMFRILSDVSRPPREGERQGIDYNFRTQDEMIEDLKKGQYIQIVLSTNGDLYGTRPASYGKTGFAVMSIWAAVVPMF